MALSGCQGAGDTAGQGVQSLQGPGQELGTYPWPLEGARQGVRLRSLEEITWDGTCVRQPPPAQFMLQTLNTRQLPFSQPPKQGAEGRTSEQWCFEEGRGQWVRGLALPPCDSGPSSSSAARGSLPSFTGGLQTTKVPGSGTESTWCLTGAHPPLRCPLQVPTRAPFPPVPPWLRAQDGSSPLTAENTSHISVLILYLHIAARKATGSPGHKWLRILQAQNTHPPVCPP